MCVGARHIPVRPLSSEEEELAMVTAAVEEFNSEEHTLATHPTNSISNISSSSNISKSGASQQIKAFSGKGHTLSSATPTSLGHTTARYSASSRLSQTEHSGRAEPSGQVRDGLERLGHADNPGQLEDLRGQSELPGQSDRPRQENSSGQTMISREVNLTGHSDLSGHIEPSDLEDPLIEQVQVVAQRRLKALRDQELSLKQMVSACPLESTLDLVECSLGSETSQVSQCSSLVGGERASPTLYREVVENI